MREARRLLIALSLVAGVGGGAFADPAKIQKAEPKLPADVAVAKGATNCLLGAPIQKLAFGKGVSRVQAKSTGAEYSASACKSFIVDIDVPSDSSGNPGQDLPQFYLMGGTTDTSLGKSECRNITTNVAFYVKKNGKKAFSKLGGGLMKGTWHDSREGGFVPVNCVLAPVAGYTAPPPSYAPPKSGSDTYRVVVIVKVGDKAIGAEAGAWHVANIH